MTHEELLAILDMMAQQKMFFDSKSTSALRAVVELHKPDDAGFCSECFGTPYVTYPCSTIRAIEKELQ